MRSAVYPPPQAEGGKCLALHWLSGLARTEPNFIPKSPGSQAAASEHSLAVGDLGTNPMAPMLEEMTAGTSTLVRGFTAMPPKIPGKQIAGCSLM